MMEDVCYPASSMVSKCIMVRNNCSNSYNNFAASVLKTYWMLQSFSKPDVGKLCFCLQALTRCSDDKCLYFHVLFVLLQISPQSPSEAAYLPVVIQPSSCTALFICRAERSSGLFTGGETEANDLPMVTQKTKMALMLPSSQSSGLSLQPTLSPCSITSQCISCPAYHLPSPSPLKSRQAGSCAPFHAPGTMRGLHVVPGKAWFLAVPSPKL